MLKITGAEPVLANVDLAALTPMVQLRAGNSTDLDFLKLALFGMRMLSKAKRLIKWLGQCRRIGCLLPMVFAEPQAQDFTYIIAGNSTITITGYTGPGGAVSIPGTMGGLSVVMIGDYAFNGLTNVTAVTIPASVTTIGTGAFENCSGLAGVALPESVANIGWYAFSYCTGLTNITIPASVTSVGNYALAYCTNLGSATVDSLIIGDYQFYGCGNLASVAIGSNVKIIGAQAFARCTSLASVAIPDSVGTIKDGMNGWVLGEGAFSSCT